MSAPSPFVWLFGHNRSHTSRGTRRQLQPSMPAAVEMLETRALLSAAAVLVNPATTNDVAPPTITGVSTPVTFVGTTGPIAIAPNLVVTEPDGLPIQSATVVIANWQAEDRLSFANSFNLQHSLTINASTQTATLTITGASSAANYQTMLRSVTYQDVAGSPNTVLSRNATFKVTDQLHSASAMTSIQVVNYIAGVTRVVNFAQGSGPLGIAKDAVLTAPAGRTVQSMTVSFKNWQNEDRLSFSNTLNLQHSFTEDFNSHTATLTITGAASVAGYQTLLRSVTYQDLAGNPITATRNVSYAVNDGTSIGTATQFVTVSKPPAYQAPIVNVNGSTLGASTTGTGPVAILGNSTITDPDSNNLSSLTVKISFGFQANKDTLSFTSMYGITGFYNAGTGVLLLTGSSYVGNYREVLRTLKFNTTGTRTVNDTRSFTVTAVDDTNVSSIPVSQNLVFSAPGITPFS